MILFVRGTHREINLSSAAATPCRASNGQDSLPRRGDSENEAVESTCVKVMEHGYSLLSHRSTSCCTFPLVVSRFTAWSRLPWSALCLLLTTTALGVEVEGEHLKEDSTLTTTVLDSKPTDLGRAVVSCNGLEVTMVGGVAAWEEVLAISGVAVAAEGGAGRGGRGVEGAGGVLEGVRREGVEGAGGEEVTRWSCLLWILTRSWKRTWRSGKIAEPVAMTCFIVYHSRFRCRVCPGYQRMRAEERGGVGLQ